MAGFVAAVAAASEMSDYACLMTVDRFRTTRVNARMDQTVLETISAVEYELLRRNLIGPHRRLCPEFESYCREREEVWATLGLRFAEA
jgi:hypothetical protein